MTVQECQALIDDGQSGAQVQIWIEEGKPLTQTQWEHNGYVTFSDYVLSLKNEAHPRWQAVHENLPLCSIGFLDMKEGIKQVVQLFDKTEDLPKVSIEGLLTFNE